MMPTYDYACDVCGNATIAMRAIDRRDAALRCVRCGSGMRRIIGGFYTQLTADSEVASTRQAEPLPRPTRVPGATVIRNVSFSGNQGASIKLGPGAAVDVDGLYSEDRVVFDVDDGAQFDVRNAYHHPPAPPEPERRKRSKRRRNG